MNISIDIKESDSAIEAAINKALIPQVKSYMDTAIAKVKKQLPSHVQQVVESAPEYSSLINGKLRYNLGIPDAGPKLAGLISIWTQNIDYLYLPPNIIGGKMKSIFSASLFRIDFSDVLYSDYAQVADSMRGYSLPWLKWLSLDGRVPLVQEHEIVVGPHRRSRTNQAIMSKKTGKTWAVPSEFAGDIGDNWITRSIASSQKIFEDIFLGAFTK